MNKVSAAAPGIATGLGPVLLPLALLVACSGDPTAPPGPGEVKAVVTPTRAWHGDTLTLEWDWLAGRVVTPEFLVGDSSAQFRRIDDRRVQIVVPTVAAGPTRVAAVIEGVAQPLGIVETFGWAGSDALPQLRGARPWPSPAGTEVIGVAGDGALTVLDLATGASRSTGPSPYKGNITEIGLSYRPGVAVIHEHDHLDDSATGWARMWRMDPVPVLIDSLWTGGHLHLLYEIGAARYLRGHNGDVWITEEPFGLWPETGTGVAVPSPRWDRMVFYNGNFVRPVFVLDVASGQPAWSLPGYDLLVHGAFTADGAEAFLTVVSGTMAKVAHVNAGTGQLLAEAELHAVGAPPWYPRVAIVGGRVLVAYNDRGRSWHVQVRRASDLSLEADLAIPGSESESEAVLVASPDGSSAFILSAGSFRHRIDLLPE